MQAEIHKRQVPVGISITAPRAITRIGLLCFAVLGHGIVLFAGRITKLALCYICQVIAPVSGQFSLCHTVCPIFLIFDVGSGVRIANKRMRVFLFPAGQLLVGGCGLGGSHRSIAGLGVGMLLQAAVGRVFQRDCRTNQCIGRGRHDHDRQHGKNCQPALAVFMLLRQVFDLLL